MNDPECIWNADCVLGEGPVWDDTQARLYFVDIKRGTLFWLEDDGERNAWELGGVVSAVGPLRSRAGLIAATDRGLELLDPDTRTRRLHCPLEPDQSGNRPNDGKADRWGRFWIGTMDDTERDATGALYRVDPGRAPVRVFDDVGIANGLDWSPDGRAMYFTDSMRSTIWRFEHDSADGAIANPRAFRVVPTEEGWPDGLCVDSEGFVWSAHWDGWRVTRYAPDGAIDRVIRLPVPRVTSCCFGGANLDRLFITTARVGLDEAALEAAPLSGGLFAYAAPSRGQSGAAAIVTGETP